MAFWAILSAASVLLLFISAAFVLVDLLIVIIIKIRKKGKDPFQKYRLIFMVLYMGAFLLLILAIIETTITHDPTGNQVIDFIIQYYPFIGGVAAIPVIYSLSIFWYRTNKALDYIENEDKGLPSQLKNINQNLTQLNIKLDTVNKDMTRVDADLQNCKSKHKKV